MSKQKAQEEENQEGKDGRGEDVVEEEDGENEKKRWLKEKN